MKFKDKTIRSVADMLRALKTQSKPKQIIWFRGHARRDWKLIPSLARTRDHLKAENALIKRFIQNGTPHLHAQPRDEYEWMFLMQHHRAFTRLLDWTESPLVALYFAVTEMDHHRANGAVWCLDPVELNKYANLKFEFEAEIPAFGRDKAVDSYLPTRVMDSPAELLPIAIVGPRNTSRMAAQLGTFTINHRLHKPIDKLGSGKHVWRWTIPSSAKDSLKAELSLLGFSALTLFPELDRVAELSKEMLS